MSDTPEQTETERETALPDDRAVIQCAWCGETGEVMIDVSAGSRQRYVEDCWVCCRPNVLTVTIDDGEVEVVVEPES